MNNIKTTGYFSKPLWKQDLKSNWILILIIIIIMCMMSTVINFAMSVMNTEKVSAEVESAQEDFYSYLFVMASYNSMVGQDILSYEDFVEAEDTSMYERAFSLAGQDSDVDLSVENFDNVITVLKTSPIEMEKYISNFEYVYALSTTEGCFSGEALEIEEMMSTLMELSGVPANLVESMGKMDTSSLMNQMYFHVIGLLPIFLLIVILANSLIASQVDLGSLAYTLSTPTKRSAVVITQAAFMIVVPFVIIAIVCLSRIASTAVFFDEVNAGRIVVLYTGMYLLVEAVCGICYLASCLFNQSKKSLAMGGGLTVWFFLAALLGIFGSEDLVNMGVGVEEMAVFNKLTLITLFDINSISTIGTDAVDMAFLWKFGVLALVALVCYVAGAVKFTKKDLPL